MTKMTMPQLHVGRGLPFGPSGVVTVFPVWSAATPIRGLATGTQAKLEVGEHPEGPRVEMLSIRNRGSQPALVLEGELFEGGWQTRALVRDAILPVGGPYPVDVACVEQHRWGGGVGHHRRARRSTARVQMSLRANHSERQARVWSDVERYQSVRRVPTASLADQLEEASQERGTMDPPIRPLAGQCGALIGIGGQPLLLEVFGSPAALASHLMPFVETAMFEALSADVGEPVPSRRARRMLARLDPVDLWADDLDDGGVAVRADTSHAQIRGVALADRRIAHLSILNIKHPLLEMT